MTALRRRASEVIDAELLRLDARLPALDPAVREEFAQTVRRVVDKLLHTPTVQVKRLAEGPDGSSYAARPARAVRAGPADARRGRRAAHGDVLAALEAPMQAVREMSDPAPRRVAAPRQPPGGAPVTAPAQTGPLRLGTRPSALAVAQSELVAQRLRAAGHTVELVTVSTSGDRSSAPIATLGVGVFVSQLRDALVAGEVDLAVHSYKDLPTAPDPRLVIAAVPPREDPRDALVARDGRVLGELPAGATVGTGLAAARRPARGPRPRPAHRADPGQRRHPHRQGPQRASSTPWWSPRPGCAGSAASTRRASCSTPCRCCPHPRRVRSPSSAAPADTALAALLAQVLDDAGARAAVTAERAVLATLEAGCSAPVGALADVVSDLTDDGRVVDRVFLRAVVGTADGALLRASATGRPRRRREARCGARRRAARHGEVGALADAAEEPARISGPP